LERILARRLRELAAERGMPVSHVADHAGVSRSLVWEIFDQSASVTLDTLQKLAGALGLDDPLDLLRGDPATVKRRSRSTGGTRPPAKRRKVGRSKSR
jgi:transcriptional regulator with XRE-family HTH domain